ncbi:hypothetical protein V8E54_008507 [Elaphomyces granulatus]
MATEELYLLDGFLMIIDGSDEEALPEDRIVANGPMSPSQIQLKLPWHCTLASRWPALATEWVWPYFEVTTVEREWIVKRTGKRRIVDRDICCAYVDEKTGTKCDWKTTDSANC